ncbi:MAG: universal stress protein, partial [Chloroflexota bacterium]
ILPCVAALAKGLGAQVTLTHVVNSKALPDTDELSHRAFLDQLVEHEELRARAYLQRVATLFTDQGVATTTDVYVGEPAETLIQHAEKEHFDLIATSTHGRAGLARVVMGSVADKILRSTAKPLLLYRPVDELTPAFASLKSLVIPLDGSDFSEQALPLAVELAQALHLTLMPIRTIPTASFAFTEPYPLGGTDLSAQLLESAEQDAGSYLDRRFGSYKAQGMAVEPMVAIGEPATKIIDLASGSPGSLIVMASHGRSGVGRFVLGSVADRVVRTSGSPVLLVRARAVDSQ